MANTLIETIKNIDIVELINNYLPLSKKGANYMGICPFHHDKNPSLSVSPAKQMFKCFTCNVGGDGISFVSRLKNLTYYEAAILIGKDFNLDSNLITSFSKNYSLENENNKLYQLNQDFLSLSQNFLFQKDCLGLKYLEKRGLNKQIIEHFGIGYCPDNKANEMYQILTNENHYLTNANPDNLYTRQQLLDAGLISLSENGTVLDFFKARVVFSIKNEHSKIIGFSGRSIDNNLKPKYLNTQETKIFHKNKVLYHWSEVKKLDQLNTVYLVEGFMDVIALYRCEVKNSIATMGISFNPEHLLELKENNVKSITLAFDNDDAGLQAKKSVGLSIAKQIDTFVTKPFLKGKDFDELLQLTNPETVRECLNAIEPFSIFYLNQLKDELNVSNDSVKLSYWNEAITFLKQYGNKLYLDQYVQILFTVTNFDQTIIRNELKFLETVILKPVILKKSLPTFNSTDKSVNKKKYEFNSENYLKRELTEYHNDPLKELKEAVFNSLQRLLNFAFLSRDMIVHLDQDFLINLKIFPKQLTNFYLTVVSQLKEWYELNPKYTKLNGLNLAEFLVFWENNGESEKYLFWIKNEILTNDKQMKKFDLYEAKKALIITQINLCKLRLREIADDFNNLEKELFSYTLEEFENISKLHKNLSKRLKEIESFQDLNPSYFYE